MNAVNRLWIACALLVCAAAGLAQPATFAMPTLDRGPYLQQNTPTSITLRWRTSEPDTTRVRYGDQPGALNLTWTDFAFTTEHEARLEGLQPATRYYYSVGSDQTVLAGDDDEHFFTTSPAPGTPAPMRIWVQGDSGTADSNADAVYAAYLANEATGRGTDLWLMLGDNAYNLGTDAEYQSALFDRFGTLLRRTPLWSAVGNHDTFSNSDPGFQGPYPYYDIFTLPSAGEAGGLSSGTEAYYSFDYGNVHFIVLDSMISSRAVGGSMWLWLQADLATTQQDWIVAAWHHPPYTKGSHDSDLEGRLIDMRENFVPLLEAGGVDLVLSGHSHSYERSLLIDGHYGESTEFGPAFSVDSGDGRVGGDGPYQKATLEPTPNQGAVYTVAGSSGKISGGVLDHPAMRESINRLGSVILDIEGGRLDATFLTETGEVLDRWTMTKGLAAPVADFVSDLGVGRAPLAIRFSDASSGFPSEWSWDFQDDGFDDSTERQPQFTYTDPGIYSVRLQASNLAGSDSETKSGWICAQQPSPGTVSAVSLDPDDPERLSWQPGSTDVGHQIVRGSLDILRAGGGDWTASQQLCASPNAGETFWIDAQEPPSGDSWYYLIRPQDCGGQAGSFGSGSAGAPGPGRDQGLQGPAAACDCAGDDLDGDGSCDAFDDCIDTDGDGNGLDGDLCPVDNCPDAPNPAQADVDDDGVGDACDACPADADDDSDGDGSCDSADNCPSTPNASQSDFDGDGLGDVCEACPTTATNDVDGDGVCGDVDNCENVANPDQSNLDGDGLGDLCDACPTDFANDADGDGFCFDDDNCPTLSNPSQSDADSDGAGDACDACPLDPDDDSDADGLCGDVDNCPAQSNPAQLDFDGDGVGDACDPCTDTDGDGAGNPGFANPACVTDNCPLAANPTQADADSDGIGDTCDVCPEDALDDPDFDGICNSDDNCPAVANPTQQDEDSDGVGNACDPCLGDPGNDPDLDGVCSAADNCPQVPNPSQANTDTDSLGDACDSCTDSDGDGFGNPEFFTNTCPDDNCPFVGNPAQLDDDIDGIGNACDACPTDPENDIDGDNLCAEDDNCPTDFNPAQGDTDSDGIGDPCDICPNDPKNDRDGDGFCADVDNCPIVPNPGQEDTDNDGIGDACDPS